MKSSHYLLNAPAIEDPQIMQLSARSRSQKKTVSTFSRSRKSSSSNKPEGHREIEAFKAKITTLESN